MNEMFEVKVSGIPFIIKTKNLRRTLSKVRQYEADVWFKKCGAGVWIRVDAEDVEKFLNGQDIDVVYTLEPPEFRGLKAFGKATINIKSFE